MAPSTPPSLPPQPSGFFRLPRELRDLIYIEILRPDQLHHYGFDDTPLGCTKILVLNRQIHAEAMLLIEDHEHEFDLYGRGSRLFRSMFEFGLPSFFKSSTSYWKCHMPPKYCELQALRFSRISISINCAWLRWNEQCGWHDCLDTSGRDSTLMQVYEVIQVLKKSSALKYLRIKLFEPDERSFLGGPPRLPSIENLPPVCWDEVLPARNESPHNGHEKSVTLHALRRLVQVAKEKQIGLTIDSNRRFLASQVVCLSYPTGKVPAINDYEMISTPHSERLSIKPSQSIVETRILSPNYRLIPECRTCYVLFTSHDDLVKHCREQRHTKKFERKRYNLLYSRYPNRKIPRHICFACAMPFETKGAKDKHEDQTGHRREDMIPRWAEIDQNEQSKSQNRNSGKNGTRAQGRRGRQIRNGNWLNNSPADNKCVTIRHEHYWPKCNGNCELEEEDPDNRGDPRYAMRWGYPRNGGAARCLKKQGLSAEYQPFPKPGRASGQPASQAVVGFW